MIEGATAAVIPPVANVAQLKISDLNAIFSPLNEAIVKIYRTAGPVGAQQLAYARMWGRNNGLVPWFPLGIGTAANKGKINGGAAIDGSGDLVHAEPVTLPLAFDELYVELGAFTGALLAVNVELVFPRRQRGT